MIPGNFSGIDLESFSLCSHLTSVDIQKGFKSIGAEALSY